MRSYRLYLAAASLALFAACSNEDDLSLEQAPETCVATITVNVNEATTRASYDESLKFSWSDGDALSVVYKDGENLVNKKFTISNISGSSATFTCTDFPTGTKTVGVYYPYDEDGEIDVYSPTTTDFENIGNYTALYATGVNVTDGDLGNISLSHVTSYLKFPKGFKFFSDGGDFDNISTLYMAIWGKVGAGEGAAKRVIKYGVDNIDISVANGYGWSINMEGIIVDLESSSALKEDVYLPFFVLPEGEAIEVHLNFLFNRTSGWSYANWMGPEKTLKPGMIYTATSGSFPAKRVSDISNWN